MNILTDVGGVTFTFDKGLRKSLWREHAERVVAHVHTGGKVTDIFPQLVTNPYAEKFGIEVDFNAEFEEYISTVTTGEEVLLDILVNPTATALLEHIQGILLENGELTAEEMPGIRNLITYVKERGDVIKGYSTGAPLMPDQFHNAIGLTGLIGNVRTTFPTHQGKEKSPEDIVEEAVALYDKGRTYNGAIDDSDNEIAFWLAAKKRMKQEGLGDLTVHLLKRGIPTEQTGRVGTDLGQVVVINSLDLIREGVQFGTGTYTPDFSAYDGKFG